MITSDFSFVNTLFPISRSLQTSEPSYVCQYARNARRGCIRYALDIRKQKVSHL